MSFIRRLSGGAYGTTFEFIPTISLLALDISDPYSAWANFTVDKFGNIYKLATNNDIGGSESFVFRWLKNGAPADWECRLTVTGDNPNIGSVNTWLRCNVSRTWEWSLSGSGGEVSATFTVEFRRFGSTAGSVGAIGGDVLVSTSGL